MPKTNVLIVEDQRMIAKALEKRLEGMGYIVAGLAANGADGVRDALALRPDIVLMDISLGIGMDGIDAAEQVRKQVDIPIVYLSTGKCCPTSVNQFVAVAQESERTTTAPHCGSGASQICLPLSLLRPQFGKLNPSQFLSHQRFPTSKG